MGIKKTETIQPQYGNWVPLRLLYIIGEISVLFAILTFFIPWLATLAISFFLPLIYLGYARYRFSAKGGNLQEQIRGLVLDNLEWDGEGTAIDIGCGNGPLAIQLAKNNPNVYVTGVDFWGGSWEYSKLTCERNAAIEGVGDRVSFQRASASRLPFDDESFDVAVSNLCFHEVRVTKDKRDVIKEALRVIRKGGVFAFQDLFQIKVTYGEIEDLLEKVRSWGIIHVEFVNTRDSPFIPKALKGSFMLGAIGILRGKK